MEREGREAYLTNTEKFSHEKNARFQKNKS